MGARVTVGKYRRKPVQLRCAKDYRDTVRKMTATYLPAHNALGHTEWWLENPRKARRAWKAGAEAGHPFAMISHAFADATKAPRGTRTGNRPPMLMKRIAGEIACAHKRRCAKRWAARAPLLLEAAMSGYERAMLQYAKAELALLAGEEGEIPWTHDTVYLNREFPLTPAKLAVGASLSRGIPDTWEPAVHNRLVAGAERRIEAMAWFAIMDGWTEPGEQLAGAGIERASFAHQSAEVVLKVLEDLSSDDDLGAAANRRDELLQIVGPGATVWHR